MTEAAGVGSGMGGKTGDGVEMQVWQRGCAGLRRAAGTVRNDASASEGPK